jgi:dephospho-CoA kinase
VPSACGLERAGRRIRQFTNRSLGCGSFFFARLANYGMKFFGLTGGVGMGKTAAERLLRERGVPVVDTDALARQVVEPGQPALDEIQRVFGAEVIDTDGQLRREELARLVFADPAARQQLEAITHPRIRELWRAQVENWREQGCPAAVVAIPLLFETKAEADFDAVICVACTAQTQQRRLQERGWTAEQVRQRIAAQWPVEKKMALADYVVWSEGGLEVLASQLERILALTAGRGTNGG